MCLESKIYSIVGISILIISLLIAIIYLFIVFKKSKNIKNKLKFIIIALLFVLIINLFNVLLIKKCDNKKENHNVTSKVTTSTTTKVTSTTSVASTTKTEKTTTKIIVKTTTKNTTSNLTGKTSKGYDITYSNGAYYINGILIANKTYLLSSSFVPTNTHITITSSMDGFCRECINNEAYDNWTNMKNDAANAGLKIWIQSGWRSYEYQEDLYNGYVRTRGQTTADRISARPGASEHQTGLSFDLNSIDSSFANTAEGKWVNENAYKYGYIIRFPYGKDDETGYKYEPWHIRYVGKELAQTLYNNGAWITLETYLGITSKYQN